MEHERKGSSRRIVIPSAGIDVGYSHTKAVFPSPKAKGHEVPAQYLIMPSHAPVLNQTSLAIAQGADSEGVLLPDGSGGQCYVGPDVMYYIGAQMHHDVGQDFVQTPRYRLLLDGMLWMMAKASLAHMGPDVDQVTFASLVGGLPMNTLIQHRQYLTDLMSQSRVLPPVHPRGEEISVNIGSVAVIPQPLGSQLYSWAEEKEIPMQRVVTLDLGGGTFDWFTTFGRRPVYQLCDSHRRGVVACASAVAESIKKGLADDPTMVSRIEMALVNGQEHVKVGGQEVSLEPHMPASDQILHECVVKMKASLNNLESADVILLTAGGARLLQKFLAAHYPDLGGRTVLVNNPQMANAHGFFNLAQLNAKRGVMVEVVR